MISDIATSVAVSLGYLAPNTKLVCTNETGANNEQIKEHYSSQTDTSYVNKKETVEKYKKLGFDVKTPYTKYDLLSFDFNSPPVLESALKQAGFNSIDDFRQAYTNNTNDAKVSEFINKNTPDKNNYIAKDYTYESRQIENGVIGGNGTILGEEAKYAKVNNLQLLNSVTLKQHKLGISDDTSLAISSKILTDGDQEQRKGIDIHSGGCYSSTGCVTSAKIPFSLVPNVLVGNADKKSEIN